MKRSHLLFLVLLILALFVGVASANTTRHFLSLDSGYTDSGMDPADWTNNNFEIDTSDYMEGSGSAYDNSLSAFIVPADEDAITFWHYDQDWTIDFWFKANPTSNIFFWAADYSGNPTIYKEQLYMFPGNHMEYIYSNGVLKADYLCHDAPADSNWHHCAVLKNDSGVYFAFDGIFSTDITEFVAVTPGYNYSIGWDNMQFGYASNADARNIDAWRWSDHQKWFENFTITDLYGTEGGSSAGIDLSFYVASGTTLSPITGAQVIIDGSANGLPIYSGTTGSNGFYNITGVVSGAYTCDISAAAFLSNTQIVVATNDQTITTYMVPINWSTTPAPPAGYQSVNFHVHDENTGTTIPALVTLYKNGVLDYSGYVQMYSGYVGFYLAQNTQYRATITYPNYYDGFVTSFTTWGNTTPMDIYTGLYPIYIYNTTTPTPAPTSSFNVTTIATLNSQQRASKVGVATDIWYLNIDFLSELFFICVVMGALGLIGSSMDRRRRR